MVFGISFGEALIILAAGAYVFGPKELPRVGRTLGRVTGRATGFLYRARAKFFKFAEDAEISKLHSEMQATMYQLQSIKEELRGGINFMNPGPLMQQTLRIKPMPGQGVIDPYAQAGPQPVASSPAAAAVPPQQQQQQQPSFAAAPYVGNAVTAAQQQQQQAPVSNSWVAPQGPHAGHHPEQQWGSSSSTAGAVPAAGEGEGDRWQHPQHIQISAVAAGLAPDRSQGLPTGSDIMLDALFEELVAHQAAAFMQQHQHLQQGPPPTGTAAEPSQQQQQEQEAHNTEEPSRRE